MAFHKYEINEIYSNADGTVQFIELVVGNDNGENRWGGQKITVTNGVDLPNEFTFPSDLPSNLTANTSVLIATQGFADLGLVTPDYIIPDGFLFTGGGTVNFAGVDAVIYSALPGGTQSVNDNGVVGTNSPTNFAGDAGTIPGNPIVGTDSADNLAGTGSNDYMVGIGANDTLAGLGGADTLIGGVGRDTLNGGAGRDTLDGGTGNDRLNGGGGNDVLVHQAADTRVQGGAGTDTLRIEGSGVTLDLTAIANTVHTNIEVINLRGSGDNTLTVARADVLAISTTTDTLRVDGNAGDMVNAGGVWTPGAQQVIGANTYDTYTRSTATLLVDTDVGVVFV